MCGIYGLLRLNGGPAPGREMLEAMGDIIFHRGPDDSGIHLDGELAMGMRRLAIIDVSGGHQPLSNEDETLWLVCNGEIYNFRELRSELEGLGHRFKTGSDSEVILHLYEEHGDAFVQRLNGMYAFALWDASRRRLLIGRDRLGVKPLYYQVDDNRLAFGSEAKSLLAIGAGAAEIDPDAVASYLQLGYVPAPLSMFRGIRKLPVASLLCVEAGKLQVRRYWQPDGSVRHDLTPEQWAEQTADLLETCVRRQMVSDVPLGAFLSGGIDSSAVVAYMARHADAPVKTYAIGFEGGGAGGFYNELPYARQVAERFRTEHREIIVKPDVVGLLPRLIWHMDEPVADAAFITTYLVSEFARRDVTVILSGVGGDELFGGYRRYLGELYVGRYRRVPRWLRKGLLAPLARHLPSDRHSALLNLSRYAKGFLLSAEMSAEDRYAHYVQVFSPELRSALMRNGGALHHDALARAFTGSAARDPLRRLLEVDLETQLPDDLLLLTDKMSMATSLECRVPLLDHELVEFAAAIPADIRIGSGGLKSVLKRSLKDVLPSDILERKKRGFGAPLGAWIKRELSPLLDELLSESSLRARGLFDPQAVAGMRRQHGANREDYTDHLQALLNLEIWARIYLDGRSATDVADELQTFIP